MNLTTSGFPRKLMRMGPTSTPDCSTSLYKFYNLVAFKINAHSRNRTCVPRKAQHSKLVQYHYAIWAYILNNRYTFKIICEKSLMDKKLNWNTSLPIKYLPKEISKIFSIEANYLFGDLKSRMLQVELFPAPEINHVGHKVRRAIESNPEWYMKLYKENSFEAIYRSKRTKRKRKCLCSRVSRQQSLNSLSKIASKEDKPNLFHDTLYRELIFDKFYYGEDYSGETIKPIESFIKLFDKDGLNNTNYFVEEFWNDYGLSSLEDFEKFYGITKEENPNDVPF